MSKPTAPASPIAKDSETESLDALLALSPEELSAQVRASAEPTTLDQFYDIHPLEWSEEIIKTIIAGERKHRLEWNEEQTKAKTTRTPAARVPSKKVTVKKVSSDLDLDDLLGGI